MLQHEGSVTLQGDEQLSGENPRKDGESNKQFAFVSEWFGNNNNRSPYGLEIIGRL